MSKNHRPLAPDERPALGAHLFTHRTGYTHRGIYVGDGVVIHYAGLSDGLRGGPVEETMLEDFRGGQTTWKYFHQAPRFTPEQIVARARSRLGEKGYCPIANDCEHFAYWCVMGERASPQVDRVFAAAGAVKGLGRAEIIVGLKALSPVGGGAVGGVGGVAAPAVAAVGIGYAAYKAVQRLWADSP